MTAATTLRLSPSCLRPARRLSSFSRGVYAPIASSSSASSNPVSSMGAAASVVGSIGGIGYSRSPLSKEPGGGSSGSVLFSTHATNGPPISPGPPSPETGGGGPLPTFRRQNSIPISPLVTESINGRKRVYFGGDSKGEGKLSDSTRLTFAWAPTNISEGGSPNDATSRFSIQKFASSMFLGPAASGPHEYDSHQQIMSRRGPLHKVQEWMHDLSGWLRAMFLPIGYPMSVHPTYPLVHVFQFLETLVWNTVSVLCNQAMLTSLGLGADAATAGAVGIQWVLKDGLGEIGKLFFIQRFAASFDSHPKTWKLVGEAASLVGAGMQLATVVAPPGWFLMLAGLGNALRSIHYSIWGATHMTFTRNFAKQGNVGDLVAKDDAQMSVGHLLGMVLGVLALSISHTPAFLFGCFFVLGPLHLAITLSLLHAARFEVLNHTTLTLLCAQFIKRGSVPWTEELRPFERWFGEWIREDVQRDMARIRVACQVQQAFRTRGELDTALLVLQDENYLLTPIRHHRQWVGIVLHPDATAYDVIKAVLHASRLHHLLSTTHTASSLHGGVHGVQSHSLHGSFNDLNEDEGTTSPVGFYPEAGVRHSKSTHIIRTVEMSGEDTNLLQSKNDRRRSDSTFNPSSHPSSSPSFQTIPLNLTTLKTTTSKTKNSESTLLDPEAVLLLLRESHDWTKREFPRFVAEAGSREWQLDAVFWGDEGIRADWRHGNKAQ
ncbi:vitamin B6 photo-protection and homoeostasis-domain-containing protein [Phlyctochytrium arcticum]|nr:vitamin B6 photo-protection and homoeostasis-domain-containing protein [Phlyctochytrium arcticum]